MTTAVDTQTEINETNDDVSVQEVNRQNRLQVVDDAVIESIRNSDNPVGEFVAQQIEGAVEMARDAAGQIDALNQQSKNMDSELDNSEHEAAAAYRQARDAKAALDAAIKAKEDELLKQFRLSVQEKRDAANENLSTSKAAARKALFGEVVSDAAPVIEKYEAAMKLVKTAAKISKDTLGIEVPFSDGLKVKSTSTRSTGEGFRPRFSGLTVDGEEVSEEANGKVRRTIGVVANFLGVKGNGPIETALKSAITSHQYENWDAVPEGTSIDFEVEGKSVVVTK